MKPLLNFTTLMLALAGVAQAGPILTLNPSGGVISGAPGSTVGWGFTLTNDSGFLVPSLVVFCEGVFNAGCAPTFGVFTDFAAQFQLNVLGQNVTQVFDSLTHQGIGSFSINLNAPAGATDAGTIFLVYDSFSCDIRDVNCDPVQTAFSQLLSAPAQVNIVSTAAMTPEPGTFILISLGSLAFMSALGRPGFLRR